METTNRAIVVVTGRRNNPDQLRNLRTWLMSWRGLVIVGAATAAGAVAIALSQQWLAARDLLPLLYVLPCAAMMAMCAKGVTQCDTHGSRTGKAQEGLRPTDGTSGT